MGSVGTISLIGPVSLPVGAALVAYGVRRVLLADWRSWLRKFVAGPGRTRRLLLVILIMLNWKSMPFAWTLRIFHTLVHHSLRPRRVFRDPGRALFHPTITATRTSLLETDYNLHKSNSTYFSDLDVSRSHLVAHLMAPGVRALRTDPTLVRDSSGLPVRGTFGIGLGAVFCSFKKEVAPLQKFETWTRVLSWDRKWLYIVTHFVVAGKVKPTSWDGRSGGQTREKFARTRPNIATGEAEAVAPPDWGKWVLASAVSKYVFKMGRFTVHPAIVMGASGLLPERPDGWRGGGVADVGLVEEEGELSRAEADVGDEGVWDWRRVELERRRGLKLAENFAALDETSTMFDGGEGGALGKFWFG